MSTGPTRPRWPSWCARPRWISSSIREEFTIAINGTDVTEAIRDPDVSAAVSSLATNLEVRVDLITRQKQLIADSVRGIVAEGRDITTVVAPDADVRVLLVADAAARVARRHAELADRIDVHAVTDQVIRRDRGRLDGRRVHLGRARRTRHRLDRAHAG